MKNTLEINGLLFELHLQQKQIKERIVEMAEVYNNDSASDIVMVPVMTGAFYFASEYLRHIDSRYRMVTIQASSYHGVDQKETITFSPLNDESLIRDAHLVILEDIVDSGRTAHELEKYFYSLGAKKVEVVSLFYKPKQQKHSCNLVLYGFSVGPEFLVGYGLDIDEEGRYLKDVYKLKRSD